MFAELTSDAGPFQRSSPASSNHASPADSHSGCCSQPDDCGLPLSAKERRTLLEAEALPYMDLLYAVARRMVGDDARAEDLVQETYLRAIRSSHQYTPGTNCKAWLLGILRNTWIDWLRHQKLAGIEADIDEMDLPAPPQPPHPASGPGQTAPDPRELLEAFSDERIIRALRQLPPDHRLTLFLLDVEQLTYAETAEIMGIPPGTAKSRASQARAMLRDRLREHAKDLGFPARNETSE